MAYTLEILIIIFGIVYGYLKPGKEDRSTLLKKGVVIGIILGAIMVVLGLIGGRWILLLGTLAGAKIDKNSRQSSRKGRPDQESLWEVGFLTTTIGCLRTVICPI